MGCHGAAPQKEVSDISTKQLEQAIGHEIVVAVRNAEHCETCRVSATLAKSAERIGPYAKLHSGPDVKRMLLTSIKANLLNDAFYDFDNQTKCPFFPEVAFNFDDGSATIFVSFTSRQVEVMTEKGSTILDIDLNQTSVGKIAKQLFPFDSKFEKY